MKLTLQKLMETEPDTIFASGLIVDSPKGINMINSGKMLRWVAVRGRIHDWAIYCDYEEKSEEEVKNYGEKVRNEENIKKLVDCSSEVFEMYRY